MDISDPVTVPKDVDAFSGDENIAEAAEQAKATEHEELFHEDTSGKSGSSAHEGDVKEQSDATEAHSRSPQKSLTAVDSGSKLKSSDDLDKISQRNEVAIDGAARFAGDSHKPSVLSSADEILAKYLGEPSAIESTANYPVFSSRYLTLLGTTTAPSYVDAKLQGPISTFVRSTPGDVLGPESQRSERLQDLEVLPKTSPSGRLHAKLNVETSKLLARLSEAASRPPLSGLCDARVADWLRSLELANVERYIRLFAEHEVDFASLKLLSVSDLREMGVSAIGPLNKIAYAIRELRRTLPVSAKTNGVGVGVSLVSARKTEFKRVSEGVEPKKTLESADLKKSSETSATKKVTENARNEPANSAFITNVFTKVRLSEPSPALGVAGTRVAATADGRKTQSGTRMQSQVPSRKGELKLDLHKLEAPSSRSADSTHRSQTETTDKRTAHSGKHVSAAKEEFKDSKKQKATEVARKPPLAKVERDSARVANPISKRPAARDDLHTRSARERERQRDKPVAPRSRSVTSARTERPRATVQPLANELRSLERQVAELYSNATRQRSKSGGDAEQSRSERGARSAREPELVTPAERQQPSVSEGASPPSQLPVSRRLANLTEMHAMVERLQKQLATVQTRLGVAPSPSNVRSLKKQEKVEKQEPTKKDQITLATGKSRPSAMSAKAVPPKTIANKSENSARLSSGKNTKPSENAARGGVELCVVESLSPTKMRFADESVRLFTHRLLGEGHFTRVYRGTFLQRAVVLKCLKRKPATAREQAYFADECSKLRQLTTVSASPDGQPAEPVHANVAAVLGYVEFVDSSSRLARERTFAFVQTFAEGGSLFDLLHSRYADRALPHILYYRVARDVATGMNWLHAHAPEPVLHLNLTTRNVLLDVQLRARVSDFGFNRLRHAAPLFDSSELQTDRGTRSRPTPRAERCAGVCSVNYLPPELLLRSGLELEAELQLDPSGWHVLPTRANDVDVLSSKVDVFSFGMVLFEMLTRAVPFAGRSHVQIADALYRRERPALSGALNSADLERLIAACWHQVAVNRPSFTEILYRLERLALPGKWYQLVQKTSNVSLYALLNSVAPKNVSEHAYTFRSIARFIGQCLQQTVKGKSRNSKLDELQVTQFETLIDCTDYEIDYMAEQLNAAIDKGQLTEQACANASAKAGENELPSSCATAAIREVSAATLNSSRLSTANEQC